MKLCNHKRKKKTNQVNDYIVKKKLVNLIENTQEEINIERNKKW